MNELFAKLPRFSKIEALTFPCGDGVYEQVYAKVAEKDAFAYLQTLIEAGFSIRSDCVWDENRYAVLVRDTLTVRVNYTKGNTALRLIVSEREPFYTDPTPDLPAVATPSVTVMALDCESADGFVKDLAGWGSSFLFRLSDGRLIVLDGGQENAEDAEALVARMERLGGKKPTVAAWILSHPHGDHYGNLRYFLADENAALWDRIGRLEAFFCNLPDSGVVISTPTMEQGTVEYVRPYLLPLIERKARAKYQGFQMIKLHTGDALHIGDAKLEVLYCQEDLFPESLVKANNLSVCFKLTLGGKVLLFPSDMETAAANALTRTYRDCLRADYVQMTHHGWNPQTKADLGATVAIYKRAAAKYAFLTIDMRQLKTDDRTLCEPDHPHLFRTVVKSREDYKWITDPVNGIEKLFSTEDGTYTIALLEGSYTLEKRS